MACGDKIALSQRRNDENMVEKYAKNLLSDKSVKATVAWTNRTPGQRDQHGTWIQVLAAGEEAYVGIVSGTIDGAMVTYTVTGCEVLAP